jgi:hypothetical protein
MRIQKAQKHIKSTENPAILPSGSGGCDSFENISSAADTNWREKWHLTPPARNINGFRWKWQDSISNNLISTSTLKIVFVKSFW